MRHWWHRIYIFFHDILFGTINAIFSIFPTIQTDWFLWSVSKWLWSPSDNFIVYSQCRPGSSEERFLSHLYDVRHSNSSFFFYSFIILLFLHIFAYASHLMAILYAVWIFEYSYIFYASSIYRVIDLQIVVSCLSYIFNLFYHFLLYAYESSIYTCVYMVRSVSC